MVNFSNTSELFLYTNQSNQNWMCKPGKNEKNILFCQNNFTAFN